MFEIKQNERKIMETKHNFSANLPILKNSPLFQGLSDGEILSVLPCVADKLLSVPDGQYVFRAGENISSMGLVLSGSLLIIQEDVWGHRHMIHKITAGDIFGEPYAAVPDTKSGDYSCRKNPGFQQQADPFKQTLHERKTAFLSVGGVHPSGLFILLHSF